MTKYLLLGLSLALASCATQKALPHYTEAEKAAQRQAIGYWQPAPTKPDSTSGPRVEPGSQADLICSIFGGHPPVMQQDTEATPDSLHFVKVAKPARRLFGLLPAKKLASPTASLRKCKGCTFIIGDNTTLAGKKAQVAAGTGAVASNIEKKAGPAQIASDSSTQNALSGGGNLAAVHGDGNTLPQTATTQQASDWRAELAKPAGEVAATALGLVLVGGLVWVIIAYKRRKALSTNG
jgi:hypothetical protein